MDLERMLRMCHEGQRMQLLGAKPGLGELPLLRFWNAMMNLYHHPRSGPRAKAVIARIVGSEPEFMEKLATEDELARAAKMTFDELAAEALAVKATS